MSEPMLTLPAAAIVRLGWAGVNGVSPPRQTIGLGEMSLRHGRPDR